jgi:hypothetical protein
VPSSAVATAEEGTEPCLRGPQLRRFVPCQPTRRRRRVLVFASTRHAGVTAVPTRGRGEPSSPARAASAHDFARPSTGPATRRLCISMPSLLSQRVPFSSHRDSQIAPREQWVGASSIDPCPCPPLRSATPPDGSDGRATPHARWEPAHAALHVLRGVSGARSAGRKATNGMNVHHTHVVHMGSRLTVCARAGEVNVSGCHPASASIVHHPACTVPGYDRQTPRLHIAWVRARGFQRGGDARGCAAFGLIDVPGWRVQTSSRRSSPGCNAGRRFSRCVLVPCRRRPPRIPETLPCAPPHRRNPHGVLYRANGPRQTKRWT